MDNYVKLSAECSELCNQILSHGDDHVSFPPMPLKVLPETTDLCIKRGYCYHREYMTTDTCQSKCQSVPTSNQCCYLCVCLMTNIFLLPIYS